MTAVLKCWRCEGKGQTREAKNGYQPDICSTCFGTGEPERKPRTLVVLPEPVSLDTWRTVKTTKEALR